MDTQAQGVPGYFVWQTEGSTTVVHLHVDVIDRMNPEIMRGFGAVPKRGAEVGGILLGTVEQGEKTIVRIEDFEPIACTYKRGPSYLLTEEDGAAFEEAREDWRHDNTKQVYAVGFYRSHTREGLALEADDFELIERHFPAPEHVVLLVKPFATRVSMAGFFLRQDGVLLKETKHQFPFRRQELSGEEAPRRRPLGEKRPRNGDEAAGEPRSRVASTLSLNGPPLPATPKAKLRSGWVWIPLSFVFLLLGVFLGFNSALSLAPQAEAAKETDYSLTLSVSRSDDNLTVRWNRDAPVVRTATRGLIEIEDGGFSKSVDLDTAHLQGGSIIYRNSSGRVRFRLIVFLNPRLNVTESLEWRQ